MQDNRFKHTDENSVDTHISHGLSFRDAIPLDAAANTMRAYFNRGENCSEELSVLVPSPQSNEASTFLIPEGTVKLRLCVRNTSGYLIHAPRFFLGNTEVHPVDVVGILVVDNDALILEDDSAFIFDIPAEAGSFSVLGCISPVADHTAWNSFCSIAKRMLLLKAELEHTKETTNHLRTELADLETKFRKLESDHTVVIRSSFWRITKPFRLISDLLKKVLRHVPFLVKFKKGMSYLFKNGVRRTYKKLRDRSVAKRKAKRMVRYTPDILRKQRAHVFSEEHTFSILVPLYNTPPKFLREMINSVTEQTYGKWELCLADGSDTEHTSVGEYCRALAEKDPRIKYRKLEKNMGISENTNACIDMATGDYIVLFDHDDILHPAALYEFMSTIEETGADFLYTDENTFSKTPAQAYCPHHKPDFSPDTLRSYNYICHLSCFSRELLEKTGRFRRAFDGSQDYDMILRLTEKAKRVAHIPRILYFWRAHASSVASDISAKPYTLAAAKRALAEHLDRVGLSGEVLDSRIPSTYRIRYAVKGAPLVSIIIPNMDHTDVLSRCIESIEQISSYQNFEILVVENNSKKAETFAFYEMISEKYSNIRILHYAGDGTFNFSKINNFAVKEAKGEHLLFLNNDIEIITPAWLEEMLMYSQRSDVGAVGAMLYYPDNTIQHAGVILGIGGVAGHSHKYFRRGDYGYMSRLTIAQNLSAVTAACLMMRKEIFDEIGGYDESLAVAFNDVDLCMKIREKNYLIVFTPYAEAYHHESKSRGSENTPEKVARFNGEVDRFHEKWHDVLEAGDPYYNPNLTLIEENFELI